MRRFVKILDSISERTGLIFIWLISVVLAIMIYEVISRRILHDPHVWTFEIITLFSAAHFMLLAAFALRHRAHVSIDIIYLRFSPKGQAVLDIVAYLLFFFPFVFVLFKVGFDSASASWATGETTLTAHLPIVLPTLKTIIPVAALLLLIQGLSNLVRSVLFVARGEGL